MSPQITNYDELIAFLREELNYCGCGYYEEAIRTIRDVLQFASDRQRAVKDLKQFSMITRQIDEWRLSSPGLSTWFIWLLEERGLIWHGFNASDIWINKKGTILLNAINAYYIFDDDDS